MFQCWNMLMRKGVYIMLDTLELGTTGFVDDYHLEVMSSNMPHNIYPRSNTTHYKYRKNNDPTEPLVKYTAETNKLVINIPSVSRFIYGTSLKMFKLQDLPLLYTKLEDYLQQELNVQLLVTPSQWTVQKMDIYYDFQVGKDVPDYIEAFKQIKLPKYTEGCYSNQTVFWKSISKYIQFYDKEQECLSKNKELQHIALSKGVLRFEVGIKAQEINRHFKSNLLQDVADETLLKELLKKHLELLDIWNLEVTTEHEVYRKLTAIYGTSQANKYLGYLRAKMLKQVVGSIGRTTEYRYKKAIKAAGVCPVIATKLLPPLQIN